MIPTEKDDADTAAELVFVEWYTKTGNFLGAPPENKQKGGQKGGKGGHKRLGGQKGAGWQL